MDDGTRRGPVWLGVQLTIGCVMWWAIGGPVGDARAQHVFKCVDADRVSYQSRPCEKGTAHGTWEAKPEPEPTRAERWRLQRIAKENLARNAGGRRWGARRSRGRVERRQADACETARSQRDSAYKQVGLKRDFALSSQWDNRVYDACK
ncbi:MAG TPA: DUF4124 domain-containing protein [Stenotrophomonas sp.]|jgi:hypothetical protein